MSGSGGFRADLDELRRTAQHVQSLVPRIRAHLNQLDGEMQSLWGTWQGRSSTSFQRLHSAWQQDYKQLSQALDGIGQQLGATQRTYQSADDASSIS